MLSLNLVSRELKKEIKLRRLYALVKKANFSLVIIVMTAASLLLLAKFILQNNFNETIAQTTLVTKNSQGYNDKVRGINGKIDIVSEIQKEFSLSSQFLENLAKDVPDDIHFSYLKISKADKTIKIRGKADSREGLLSLKKTLENSPGLSDMEFPIKNILKQNDIDFEINAVLDVLKL